MDTTKNISLAQAFAHCASTGSYWWGLIITLAIVAVVITGLVIASKKTEVNPLVKMLLVFACVAAIALAIFMRPTNLAANTSEAAAARGHYLGY
jgi:hypothetical protein